MSIEDIDFLYKNSTIEDIIILIDSDQRDKLIWFEPNEFQIDFVQPFKLVCGVDVLDINIPRTMYSVETHNNRLNFKIGCGIDWENVNNYSQLSCDVRDYTIQELINELNIESGNLFNESVIVSSDTTTTNENRKSVLLFSNTDNPPKPFIFDMTNSTIANILGFDEIATETKSHMYTRFAPLVSNPCMFASVPVNRRSYEISETRNSSSTSLISLTSNNNIVQELVFQNENVIDENNLRNLVGYGMTSDETDENDESIDLNDLIMPANISEILHTTIENKYNGYFINGITVDYETNTSVQSNVLSFTDVNNVEFVLPIHNIEPRIKVIFYKVDLGIVSDGSDDYNNVTFLSIDEIRTKIHNNDSSLPSYVTIVSPSFFLDKDLSDETYKFKINDDNFNKNIFSLIPIEPFAQIHYLFRLEFDLDDFRTRFSNANDTILQNYLLKYDSSLFNITIIENYITSEFTRKTQCNLKINNNIESTTLSTYDANTSLIDSTQIPQGVLSMVYNVSYVNQFKISSPGLVKLMGERYVTVHCDNIENHLRGSNMFNNYSPGMAVVNLGVVGYSHQRMDFTSVKYKKFHPIGKLNNLRFTVKRSGNKLYDLKGVNWHMLLSVKYYVPRIDTTFSKSTLNPNYDHDYMNYANKYINKYASDESDSDEEDNDKNLESNSYLKKEHAIRSKMDESNDSENSTETSSDYSSNEDTD